MTAAEQWVITGYALAFGSLLLLGGRLGDLFGRRTTFVTGLIGFAGASVVGGAVSSFEILVAARVAQGVFAALLAPAALSLLSVTFTQPAERAKAFGIFSALSGAGAAVGLLLGGMLTEWASWRWVMYVNVIFAGVALAGALLWLAKPVVTERPRIDIPGTVVVSAALFGIVYGFAHVESTSWTDPVALGSMIVGVVLLAVFVWLELRVAHPLLPLRVVLDRTRGGSFLAVFVTGMGMFSIFLFLTYYLEASIGYSPIEAGLAFLPMVAGIVASSTTVPSLLLPRVGPKVVVSVSFLVAASGMALLTQLALDSGYVADIMPGMILLGLGIGGVMTTAFQGATSGLHHEDSRRRLGADQHRPAGGRFDQHGTADHRCLVGRDRLPVLAQARRAHRGAGRGRELHGHPGVGRRDLRRRRGTHSVPDAEQGSGAVGGRARDRPLNLILPRSGLPDPLWGTPCRLR